MGLMVALTSAENVNVPAEGDGGHAITTQGVSLTDLTTVAPTTPDALEDMSAEEGARLVVLERVVERAMDTAGRVAGAALAEIRDQRLYRASHATWEDYCVGRLDLAKRTADRMIARSRNNNGLPPVAAAIGNASTSAAQRRHETLDQPPVTLDPPDEEMEPVLYPPPPKKSEAVPAPPRTPGVVQFPGDGGSGARREERTAKMVMRTTINRLIALIEGVQNPVAMALVATPVERSTILAFMRAFDIIPVDSELAGDCRHPANRIVGTTCLACGKEVKR